MTTYSQWFSLHKVAKRILLIRALRSLGQGAMVVDLALYLESLHWTGAAIGGVISGAGLFGAALILVVGVLSDRLGRRPFLLIYEVLSMLSAGLFVFTTHALPLVIAIVVAGFGRGQSGGAGPFSPAEQAWLARVVERSRRGQVFSLNNAIAFFGMAIGSLLGGLPRYFQTFWPGPSAYRPVFLMVMVLSAVCFVVLLQTPEASAAAEDQGAVLSGDTARETVNPKAQGFRQPEGKSVAGSAPAKGTEDDIRRRENANMFKLAAVNALNGLAVGLTGPMMAYWFSARFGVSAASIGLTISLSFLLTSVSSLVSGYLAAKIGMVKSITVLRIIGSAMTIALVFMPSFAAASVLYVLRNAINRGTQGNRSAVGASLTRDKRRGLATSINAFSMRLPSSIGPTISGTIFDAGDLVLPFYLTAGLQIVNAVLYQWLFGKLDSVSRQATNLLPSPPEPRS